MTKQPNRLGRGLSAIISPAATSTPFRAPARPRAVTEEAEQHVQNIPVGQIAPNPRQPRTSFTESSINELAESIRRQGVLQPVILRVLGDNQYQLVAGERRLRAAKLAGLQAVPAIVRTFTDAEALEVALIENLQREDLAPLERAAAYQQYMDTFGGTIEDLAQRLAESRANISNYLRLLKLRPEICFMLGSGELAMGQARAVAAIDDPERQLAIAKLAARRNLSVRQVEVLARAPEAPGTKTGNGAPSAERLAAERHGAEVEQSLSRGVGLRVRLYPGRRKNTGRVVIAYDSLEEFDLIAKRLVGSASLE